MVCIKCYKQVAAQPDAVLADPDSLFTNSRVLVVPSAFDLREIIREEDYVWNYTAVDNNSKQVKVMTDDTTLAVISTREVRVVHCAVARILTCIVTPAHPHTRTPAHPHTRTRRPA